MSEAQAEAARCLGGLIAPKRSTLLSTQAPPGAHILFKGVDAVRPPGGSDHRRGGRHLIRAHAHPPGQRERVLPWSRGLQAHLLAIAEPEPGCGEVDDELATDAVPAQARSAQPQAPPIHHDGARLRVELGVGDGDVQITGRHLFALRGRQSEGRREPRRCALRDAPPPENAPLRVGRQPGNQLRPGAQAGQEELVHEWQLARGKEGTQRLPQRKLGARPSAGELR